MRIILILILCLCCLGCVKEKNFNYQDKVKVIEGFYSGQEGIIVKSGYDFELRKVYKIILKDGKYSNFIFSSYLITQEEGR